MRNVLLFAIMAVTMAFIAPRVFTPATDTPVNAVAATALTPAQQAGQSPYYNAVTLRADRRGHYVTDGLVEGRRVEFMVDTGASVIALRESDANRLGVRPAPRDYSVAVSTANGVVKAAPVEVGRVEIGGISVRQVRAVVLPDQALSHNLLGMSFLSRIRWQQANGQLILEQ